MNRPIRVYTDTSVFGGVFDPEFASASRAFFERARKGLVEVVISPLVPEELTKAPQNVIALFEEHRPLLSLVAVSDDADYLHEAYLQAGVVSRKSDTDALHVAVATVSDCRAIVSWNFRHIVNFRRIPLYNGVNQMQGYGPIAIHTPAEVVFDEED